MSQLEIVDKRTGKTLGTLDEETGEEFISEDWLSRPRKKKKRVKKESENGRTAAGK